MKKYFVRFKIYKKNIREIIFFFILSSFALSLAGLWDNFYAFARSLAFKYWPEAEKFDLEKKAALIGQFGDAFGPLNAFFSLLSVIGLLLSLYFQRSYFEELQKQAEQKEQKRVIELYIQRQFEFAKEVSWESKHGWEAFSDILNSLRKGCGVHRIVQLKDGATNLSIDDIKSAYHHWYQVHNGAKTTGHYFRNFYHTVKLISESLESKQLNEIEASRYFSSLLAQTTDDELCLIFFNGLSDYGAKLKPFIEKYGFFENLDFASFEKQFGYTKFECYKASAYGKWWHKQPGYLKPINCDNCYPPRRIQVKHAPNQT